jgi:transposase
MDAKDRRIAELEALLKVALAKIAQLEAEIARLKKNSTNSSKPPSSDIVKPPKQQDRRRKKKIGAQKGHPQHLRIPFDPEQVDQTVELTLESCPKCGGTLQPTRASPKKHQQVELVEKPFIVTEYQQAHYWCEQCQCSHEAPLPVNVKRSGLFGKNLIALTAYLKGRCHMSFTTMQDFYADALRLKVSTGFLAKQVRKASEALSSIYDQLAAKLPKEAHLHIDETGSKENGKRRWTWCFRAKDFTVFHIDPSRGSDVVKAILGEDFSGKISCDFFSAYQKFAKESPADLLLCWAHLIREVKYLSESMDKRVARYGTRLLDSIHAMFQTIHRKDELHEVNWLRRMREHQRLILKVVWDRLPNHENDAYNVAVRLWNQEEDYFRFIKADLPPTNNLCEQSIRRVVLNRKITQGTRSEWGNRWWERMWSVLATCEQRSNNVMDFLRSVVGAFLQGCPPPVWRRG